MVLQIRNRPSPNHGRRNDQTRIDMLVLHYTGMTSAQAALDRLCDPDAGVSAHYLVEENGAIWRLVSEHRRAFHAGISCWEGESDLNAVSLGVEIANPGHEWGYRPFPEAQMVSVEYLCRDLISRHAIPPHRVVGHSDIAANRKTDPGELFDWSRLARAGIGIWPPANPARTGDEMDHAQSLTDLAAIGYCTSKELEGPALVAFQRRFRPTCCDGRIDPATVTRLTEVRTAFALARTSASIPQRFELKTRCSPFK